MFLIALFLNTLSLCSFPKRDGITSAANTAQWGDAASHKAASSCCPLLGHLAKQQQEGHVAKPQQEGHLAQQQEGDVAHQQEGDVAHQEEGVAVQ